MVVVVMVRGCGRGGGMERGCECVLVLLYHALRSQLVWYMGALQILFITVMEWCGRLQAAESDNI